MKMTPMHMKFPTIPIRQKIMSNATFVHTISSQQRELTENLTEANEVKLIAFSKTVINKALW